MCSTSIMHAGEIQSGQFMISKLDESESESEETDKISREDPITDSQKRVSGMPAFENLNTLFECLSLAYVDNLTSPRWSRFKGSKLALKNKIRLNNIIWREYHMQYIKMLKPIVVQFQATLDERHHSKPEGIIMEGKFWKRPPETLYNEYRHWRTFFRNRFLSRNVNRFILDSEKIQLSTDTFLDYSDLLSDIPSIPGSKSPYLIDDLLMDFDGSLDLFFDQPFPDPRDMSNLGNSDIIQPGLLQLQPDCDRFESDIMASRSCQISSQSSQPVFPTQNNNYSRVTYGSPYQEERPFHHHDRSNRGNKEDNYFHQIRRDISSQSSLSVNFQKSILYPSFPTSTASAYHAPNLLNALLHGQKPSPNNANFDNGNGLPQALTGFESTVDIYAPKPCPSSTLIIDLEEKGIKKGGMSFLPDSTDIWKSPDSNAQSNKFNSGENQPQIVTGFESTFDICTPKTCPSSKLIMDAQEQENKVGISFLTNSTNIWKSPLDLNMQREKIPITKYIQGNPSNSTHPSLPSSKNVTRGRILHQPINTHTMSDFQSSYDPSFQLKTKPNSSKFVPTYPSKDQRANQKIDQSSPWFSYLPSTSCKPYYTGVFSRSDSERTHTSRLTNKQYTLNQQPLCNISPFSSSSSLLKRGSAVTNFSDKAYEYQLPTTEVSRSSIQRHISNPPTMMPACYQQNTNNPPSKCKSISSAPDIYMIGEQSLCGLDANFSSDVPFSPNISPESHFEKSAPTIFDPDLPVDEYPTDISQDFNESMCSPNFRNNLTLETHVSSTSTVGSGFSSHSERRRRMSMQHSLGVLQELVEHHMNIRRPHHYSELLPLDALSGVKSEISSTSTRFSKANTSKMSTASVIRDAAILIKKQRSERSELDERIRKLKAEIKSLHSTFDSFCVNIPSSAPVPNYQLKSYNAQADAWFRNLVSTATEENWKFYIFGLIFRSLFESYFTKVDTDSYDSMTSSIFNWLTINCSLPQLRPLVMQALCKLSLSTSIISQPQLLLQEVREAARNMMVDF